MNDISSIKQVTGSNFLKDKLKCADDQNKNNNTIIKIVRGKNVLDKKVE